MKRTQRIIESEINTVKARLNQVQTSALFNQQETPKLVTALQKQLDQLAEELEVVDAQIITNK